MIRRLFVALAMIPIAIGSINTAPAGAATLRACPQWHDTAIAAGMAEVDFTWLSPRLWRESRCQPRASNRGRALGLAQIYWPTWGRDMARLEISKADLLDPYWNMVAATHVLSHQGRVAWR